MINKTCEMNNLFRKSLETIPEDKKLLVTKLFDITDQILDILERRNIGLKEFASMLGNSEDEIYEWMKGTYNFTEETIAKIELVLGEPVTLTINQANERYRKLLKRIDEKERQLHNLEEFLKQKGIEPSEYSYAMAV